MENTAKKYREVVMNISPDADTKAAKISYQITVRFDFSGLTTEQLIELLFDSSSLRVKFQNYHRPKGEKHLAELAAQPFVEWKVQPSGTRMATTVRVMTAQETVASMADDPEKLKAFLEQLTAIAKGQGIEA